MKRIVIIGTTGSGKTTLAEKLALKTGGVFTDLDDLYWLPGWQGRPDAEFFALAEKAAAGESWIICGNYTRLRPVIWPKADTLVWLDYPFFFGLRRLLKRSVTRIRDKTIACNGNIESWGKFLSGDSIIIWYFKTWAKNRKRYAEIFDETGQYPDLTYIRLSSHEETENWLRTLS